MYRIHCPASSITARGVITARAERMRAEGHRVRSAEVEGIHDMRVASRRLRAALSEYRLLMRSGIRKPLQVRVRDITRNLGIARELDVTLGLLDTANGVLQPSARYAVQHLRRKLRALRDEQSPATILAVESAESPEFEVELEACYTSLLELPNCYMEHASANMARDFMALHKAYKRWLDTREEEDLHEIRKDFKKLRYACEIYAPLYDKGLTKFVKELKGAQEALGAWNDWRVLRNYARQFSEDAPPRASQAMPRLLADAEKEVLRLLHQFEQDAVSYFTGERLECTLALFRWPSARCCRLLDNPAGFAAAQEENIQ